MESYPRSSYVTPYSTSTLLYHPCSPYVPHVHPLPHCLVPHNRRAHHTLEQGTYSMTPLLHTTQRNHVHQYDLNNHHDLTFDIMYRLVDFSSKYGLPG